MSLEFNTRVDYEYQGGDTVFSVPFSYINKSHIIVVINGDTENPITNITWLSENQIRINSEINTGDIVSVRRNTPIGNKMVVFEDNNILDEETQNLAQDQVFNVVQEVDDEQNRLTANMQEFVNLKDVINDHMQTITEIGNKAGDAVELMQDTQMLVNDITNTFEELKEETAKGLNCTVTHNLFAVNVFDKKLSDVEKVGWAAQDEEVSGVDYPDAIDELIKEYDEGSIKVYSTDDANIYSREYQLEGKEPIYIPQNDIISTGMTVYSDKQRVNSLGSVTSLEEIKANKYTSETTGDFFIADGVELQIGTPLYTDKLLTQSLGTITDKQLALATKYETTASGVFYLDYTKDLKRGAKVYSDALLSTEKGTISFVGKMAVDKYQVSGGSVKEFYVPSGTTIATGVEIFADKYLSQSLGQITAKGIQQDNESYYYKFKACQHSSTVGKYIYGYTKINIETQPAWELVPVYSDKLCTKPLVYYTGSIVHYCLCCWFEFSGKKYHTAISDNGRTSKLDILSDVLNENASTQLISTSSDTTSTYITISGSTDKLTYYKQATVEDVDVITINEGDYQGYTLKEVVSSDVIKINDNYETYKQLGTEVSQTITIDNGDKINIINSVIVATAGIAFEYREHSNGHKIALANYKSAIQSWKEDKGTSDIYVLDKTNDTFLTPLLDSTKNIYFCVGNTLLNRAAILPLTKQEADKLYFHKDNEALQAFVDIILTYTDTVGDIQSALSEILGEEE